ncbi:MAG: glycosyltransferase family 2 protein [Planctomycetota bacterium]
MPRVTVIIPTYNRRRMLPEAIDGALAQTFQDFELIVVDDESTDGTVKMLEDRYGGDSRVRVIEKPHSGGPAPGRQLGLEQAQGDIIASLDSDDWWDPGYLESVVRVFDSNPGIDYVLSNYRTVGDPRHDGTPTFDNPYWRLPDTVEALAHGAWVIPSASCVRASAARNVGFDSGAVLGEDTDLVWRLLLAGHRLVGNPELFVNYRVHTGVDGDITQMVDVSAEEKAACNLALLDRYAKQAGPTVKRRRREMHRLAARRLVAESRWIEARPHLWRWWRLKLGSLTALRWWVLSFFKGGEAERKPKALDARGT